jgi:hypothetical protein
LAGSLAHLLSAELHLLHAMGLRGRPLRAINPALKNLGTAMDTAVTMMWRQARVLLPFPVETAPPVVDLDESMTAILRHAALTEPMAVVTGPVWQWGTGRGLRDTLSAAALENLKAPLLIVREERRQTYNRVVVTSHNDLMNEQVIEDAGRWAFWLERVYRDPLPAPMGPQFDLVRVDDSTKSCDLLAAMKLDRADLVVMDCSTLKDDRVGTQMNGVMSQLLRVSIAPVVVVNPRKP